MSITDMINSQPRNDGQIIPGVYITMTSRNPDKPGWLYIGTKLSGPMLQYQPHDAVGVYDGTQYQTSWLDGAWTPIYSWGNYGRNYSCGGQWSTQTCNLHPAVRDQTRRDCKSDCSAEAGGPFSPLPDEITGNELGVGISVSGAGDNIFSDHYLGWTVWYPSAKEAIGARLTPAGITGAKLPQASKTHLFSHEGSSVALLLKLVRVYSL